MFVIKFIEREVLVGGRGERERISGIWEDGVELYSKK